MKALSLISPKSYVSYQPVRMHSEENKYCVYRWNQLLITKYTTTVLLFLFAAKKVFVSAE
jgi:hypothetical protein